jgi:hypothetical protein
MAHKESTSSLHLQTYDKQRCSDIPGCCFWQTSSVPRGAQLKTPPPLSSPVQQPSQTEQNFQMIIYGNMSCPCSNVHTTSSTVHSTIFMHFLVDSVQLHLLMSHSCQAKS